MEFYFFVLSDSIYRLELGVNDFINVMKFISSGFEVEPAL